MKLYCKSKLNSSLKVYETIRYLLYYPAREMAIPTLGFLNCSFLMNRISIENIDYKLLYASREL